MSIIDWLFGKKKEQESGRTNISINACARCGKRVPEFVSNLSPFTHISGLPFGRCEKCGKIWCYDCAAKDEVGNLVYYKCPRCDAQLKSRL